MPGLTGRRDRRGATSVMVAMSMLVLLGFAALAIDIAALYGEQQRLQVGADAAALAIASDCARGSCGAATSTARHYVTANTDTTGATASLDNSPTPAGGEVTVAATAATQHWFAQVLGVDSTGQTVRATARWGAPSGGRAVLPLTFGWCEWYRQTGGGTPSSTTPRVIRTTKTSGTGCTGPSGNALPGGFGWLTPTGSGCDVVSQVDGWIASEPGNSPSCAASIIRSYHNGTVLLPIYDRDRGTGRNGEYHVMGYAAFRLTGYNFSGLSWNPPCSGNDRCIAGYFEKFVADGSWSYSTSAPAFGATVVRLTA